MKTVIIFIGLIVQVNQPMSLNNTAVLVAAPGHAQRLIIPFDSIIEPDEWLMKQPRNGPNVEIDLAGATLRVRRTRGIVSDLNDDFLRRARSLRQLAPGCRLRDEVRARQIVPDKLAAYVDFRGGRVMPEAYLPRQLSFTGDVGDARCAVCRLRYEADLRGDHVTLVYKKKTIQDGREAVETHRIRVNGGRPGGSVPEITVSNRPPAATAGHAEHAFNIYADGCNPVRPRPLVTSFPCTELSLCPGPDGTGPADPGDDCTIDTSS